jgi:hypothetical protein
MTPLLLAIGLVISSPAQGTVAIAAEEVSYQSEAYQRWWGQELVWRFDDLPTKGGVLQNRIPYSGHDYPDRSGGTVATMQKYDIAFHQGRSLATAFEQQDTTAITEPTMERRGLLRLRRTQVERTPGWHGHCNGWTAAAIRHAEPQKSVRRGGVTFTPADIKALLAELYMYNAAEFLGGDEADDAINPGTLHVSLTNWLGRNQHPLAMDSSLGREVWNYPIYAFSSTSAKRRAGKQVEVRLNIVYAGSTNREYDKSPRVRQGKSFHYLLDLDDEGNITGGQYFSDSARIDMLWTPLRLAPSGQAGNERGNPHIDINEVLAVWRESVPEELRQNWVNIDDAPPLADEQQAGGSDDARSVGEE